jgi:hypothetical protein
MERPESHESHLEKEEHNPYQMERPESHEFRLEKDGFSPQMDGRREDPAPTQGLSCSSKEE